MRREEGGGECRQRAVRREEGVQTEGSERGERGECRQRAVRREEGGGVQTEGSEEGGGSADRGQ